MECTSCGAMIDRRDAFCAKCGELTEHGQPVAQKIGSAVSALSTESGKLLSWVVDYVSDPAHRKQVIAGGATIALLLVVLTDNPITAGVSSLFSGDENSLQLTKDGLPDFASYEDAFIGDDKEFTVTGTANVRDFPTSQGTTITHTFAGGEKVFAREVRAFDPTSQWFKLTSGGYVWSGNLSSAWSVPASTGPQFPARLRGEWSDFSDCTGEGSGVSFSISADQLDFGSVVYNLVGPTTIDRGYPAFSLVESNQSNLVRPMTLFEDAELPIIWIWYGEDRGNEQYHYFKIPDSCDGAISINEQIRSRGR